MNYFLDRGDECMRNSNNFIPRLNAQCLIRKTKRVGAAAYTSRIFCSRKFGKVFFKLEKIFPKNKVPICVTSIYGIQNLFTMLGVISPIPAINKVYFICHMRKYAGPILLYSLFIASAISSSVFGIYTFILGRCFNNNSS